MNRQATVVGVERGELSSPLNSHTLSSCHTARVNQAGEQRGDSPGVNSCTVPYAKSSSARSPNLPNWYGIHTATLLSGCSHACGMLTNMVRPHTNHITMHKQEQWAGAGPRGPELRNHKYKKRSLTRSCLAPCWPPRLHQPAPTKNVRPARHGPRDRTGSFVLHCGVWVTLHSEPLRT